MGGGGFGGCCCNWLNQFEPAGNEREGAWAARKKLFEEAAAAGADRIPGMNTTTPLTVTIIITGQTTLDAANLEHLVLLLQNQPALAMPSQPTKLVYTVAEAAVLLGVSNPVVYRLIVRGHPRTSGR